MPHRGGSEWCYSPALLCHHSILWNAQSDLTALKTDPEGSFLPCKVAIVLSHNL